MIRTRFPLAVLVLATALLLALAACGDDDVEDLPDSDGEAFATNTAAAATVAGSPSPLPTVADCPAPSLTAPEVTLKQYDAAPEMTIDPAKQYIATIKTVRGDIKIKLRPDLAPLHVNSFVFLARDGYYDGVTFHRVLPGFVAQAGDPTGTGTGGPGYTINGEFSAAAVAKFERGTLGMARTSDFNSAGSQWFINYVATPALDNSYTIFGEVVEGMEVVDCLTPRDPSASANQPPGDAIVTIEIAEN